MSSSPSLEGWWFPIFFTLSSSPTHWQFMTLTWILISHREAVQSACRAAPGEGWDLWCHRSHYQSWWPESPAWATRPDLPAYTDRKTLQTTCCGNAWWKICSSPSRLHYSRVQTVQYFSVSGEPHLTVGCCGGESTQCRPWCPRLTLCSTPPLSDPGQGGLFRWIGRERRTGKLEVKRKSNSK